MASSIRFAAVAIAMAVACSLSARTTPLKGTPPERLLAQAAKSTTTVVIVGVRVPGGWTVADTRIPAKAADQRRRARQAKENLLRAHLGARRIKDRDFENIPYFMLEVNQQTLRRLLDDDDVTSVEENNGGYRTLSESTAIIGSAAANFAGYVGGGQTVAVIDDGVAASHSFFGGRVIQAHAACFSGADGFDANSLCPNGQPTQYGQGAGEPCVVQLSPADPCGHGTEVAGVITGYQNSSFFGVAPAAWILPIQVYQLSGDGRQHHQTMIRRGDVTAALNYLLGNVRTVYNIAAVNLSLALDGGGTRGDCITQYAAMETAVSALRANGTAVIAGAGNAGAQTVNAPACLTDAIAVGATTDADAVAGYSDTPGYLRFFAPGGAFANGVTTPGQGIWTSALGGGYVETSGTSIAAPHVAGAFAILRDASPTASVATLEAALTATGTPITVRPGLVVPRINVNAARNTLDTTPPATPASFVATGDSNSQVALSWTASPDGDIAHYEISRRASGWGQFDVVAEVPGVTHTDTFQLAASKMYEYQIVAVDTSGFRSAAATDHAVTVTFTDDPIPVPDPNNLSTYTMIRGEHVGQLRAASDAWREFAQLGRLHSSYSVTGTVTATQLAGQVTSAVNALNAARQALSLPAFSYSGVDAPASDGVIRRLHVQQLRDVMR